MRSGARPGRVEPERAALVALARPLVEPVGRHHAAALLVRGREAGRRALGADVDDQAAVAPEAPDGRDEGGPVLAGAGHDDGVGGARCCSEAGRAQRRRGRAGRRARRRPRPGRRRSGYSGRTWGESSTRARAAPRAAGPASLAALPHPNGERDHAQLRVRPPELPRQAPSSSWRARPADARCRRRHLRGAARCARPTAASTSTASATTSSRASTTSRATGRCWRTRPSTARPGVGRRPALQHPLPRAPHARCRAPATSASSSACRRGSWRSSLDRVPPALGDVGRRGLSTAAIASP